MELSNLKTVGRNFEVVVMRALIDSEFRRLLLNDRAAALQQYSLSKEEVQALSKIDQNTLDIARQTASIVGCIHG